MIKFTFLGDIMCTEPMLEAFRSGSSFDFTPIFRRVKPLLAESDYVFGNLETPISLHRDNLTNEKYCFCSPIEFAEAVKDAGIDFVSTANNHCLDRGVDGIESTVSALDRLGLSHTGVFPRHASTNPSIINVKGVRLGVLAYTYGTNAFSNHNYLNRSERWMVNMTQNQELSNSISRWCYYNRGKLPARVYNKFSEIFCPGQLWGPVYERRERSSARIRKIRRDINFLNNCGVDLSIMLLHHGGQYNHSVLHRSKSLVDKMLLGGVNIVCGNHEHVVHSGVFQYPLKHNRIATYSLGNFNSTSGTFISPYDKLSEYSIAWHVYVDEDSKKLIKSTFTILKSVAMADGKIEVAECHELLNCPDMPGAKEQNDRIQILCDMQTVAFRFTERRFAVDELQSERELLLK